MVIKKATVGFLVVTFLIFSMFSHTEAATDNPLKIRASALMGFDDNVNLNSTRKSDLFGQETISLNYQKRPTQSFKYRLSSNLINVNYFEVTDQNIFLPSVGAGLDIVVFPKTVLETDYNFSYIDFPNDISVSSFNHDGRIGLKRVLTKDLILRVGFDASSREFEDRKLTQANGFLSTSTERNDRCYAVDSDLSIYASNNTLLKLGFIYDWNDSNDLFHDYYDYEDFKFFTGVSVEWSPKISAFAKFSYERRDYHSRPLLDFVGVFENDDIYSASGGLFYKFTPNISLSGITNYRQKNSNEPSQKYSGLIFTLGFTYSF